MGYKTPETIPSGFFCARFFIPDDIYILAAVRGAILELAESNNWTQLGSVTPEQMASRMLEMYNEGFSGDACMIGALVHYITDSPPPAILACDGSIYNRVNYPKLYAALPASLILDADTFQTPVVQDVFMLATGTSYAQNDTGGSVDHTLTTDELPAHQHTYNYPSPNVDIKTAGAPDITALGNPPVPTLTDSVGNNQPHNNMPPFVAYHVGIVAR